MNRDVGGVTERTVLLGMVLLLSAASSAIVFVLTQYFGTPAFSSLVFQPLDCRAGGWQPVLGQHCFADYGWSVKLRMRPNPWDGFTLYTGDINDYSAAALMPPLLFAVLAGWLHAPSVGVLTYVLVLAIAVLFPAAWAARGACGLERVVVFVACGAAALPAWAAIDPANSVGFIAPIGLAFLVALCRQRWGIVTIAVVTAALVKPQFVVLVVVLFAARRWRLGGIAVAAAVLLNTIAYLAWPKDFPDTILQSIRNVFSHGIFNMGTIEEHWNRSFARGLLVLPDYIAALNARGDVPEDFLTKPPSLIGYAVLVVTVACVLILGRRIPPVMVGIVLLAVTSLFPTFTYSYYLVFVIPIAALVARDPDGPAGRGILTGSGRAATVVWSASA